MFCNRQDTNTPLLSLFIPFSFPSANRADAIVQRAWGFTV